MVELEFGRKVDETLFATANQADLHLVAHSVRTALERREPRFVVDDVTATTDPSRPGVVEVSIDYVIRAKNRSDDHVCPLPLAPG